MSKELMQDFEKKLDATSKGMKDFIMKHKKLLLLSFGLYALYKWLFDD